MILEGHKIGFRGEYTATVIKADGTVKENLNESGTLKSGQVIKNRLLDNFFAKLIATAGPLGSGSGNLVSIRCGTGSDAVNDSQSNLSNQMTIAGNWPNPSRNSPAVAVLDGGILRASLDWTFTFNLGAIVGNIAELGVNFNGTPTSSNTLIHSRALVVDSEGDPTVISVGANEQLILNYELFMEIDAADLVHTVPMLINGVESSVEVTTRLGNFQTLPSYITSFSGSATVYAATGGSLGGVGTSPSGASATTGSSSVSYSQDGGVEGTFSLSISQGNLSGGIGALRSPGSAWKFGFNPPIPKNADRTLSITVRHTFGRLPE